MKKRLLILLFSILGFSTQSQIVNIPDANFKNALVSNTTININGDSEIQTAEATAYTGSIDVGSTAISDMTGIEAFTNITTLSCGFNNLTSLDISQNTSLTGLWCLVNNIATLTLNTSIKILDCGDNKLTNLNLAQSTVLETVQCGDNLLTSIDISSNPLITWLACQNNKLTAIDITSNTAINILECNDNLLTSASLKNGNNTNITTFNITNNTNLTCIEVDDADWSNSNWPNKDAGATYNTNCNTASIDDVSIKQITVVPNPVINNLEIKSDLRITKIYIYNLLGKLLLKKEKTSLINVTNLSKGVYLIKIKSEKGMMTRKFIKK